MTETPHADDLIQEWIDGDLSIEDADEIRDIDGWNIEARFLTEDGWVILTYELDSGYRPIGDGSTMIEEFDPEDVDP